MAVCSLVGVSVGDRSKKLSVDPDGNKIPLKKGMDDVNHLLFSA